MDMTFLRLTDELTTGVRAIDSQHAGFLDIYNSLLRVIATHHGERIVLSPILAELFSYIDYHFRTEEALMRSIAYPDYARHKKMHERMAEAFDDLCCRLDLGTADLDELVDMLRGWITGHMADVDIRLGEYYRHVRKAQNRASGG